MEIDLIELDSDPVILHPDRRVTRGRGNPAVDESLTDRASLGRPVVIELTPERAGDDKPLAAFIEAESSKYRYALVYLAATFTPQEGERFARAWVTVDLNLVPGESGEAPIAWSMEPIRSSNPLTWNRSLSVHAHAGFAQTTGQSGSTSTMEMLFCLANGLQSSRPYWELTDTDQHRLSGSHQFHLVVRAPLGRATGIVSLRSQILRSHLGLFSYSSRPLDEPPQPFEI